VSEKQDAGQEWESLTVHDMLELIATDNGKGALGWPANLQTDVTEDDVLAASMLVKLLDDHGKLTFEDAERILLAALFWVGLFKKTHPYEPTPPPSSEE
jgi:hypothetical protein